MPVEIIEDTVNGCENEEQHLLKGFMNGELKREDSLDSDGLDTEKRDRTKSDVDKDLKDDQKEIFVKLLTRFLRYFA